MEEVETAIRNALATLSQPITGTALGKYLQKTYPLLGPNAGEALTRAGLIAILMQEGRSPTLGEFTQHNVTNSEVCIPAVSMTIRMALALMHLDVPLYMRLKNEWHVTQSATGRLRGIPLGQVNHHAYDCGSNEHIHLLMWGGKTPQDAGLQRTTFTIAPYSTEKHLEEYEVLRWIGQLFSASAGLNAGLLQLCLPATGQLGMFSLGSSGDTEIEREGVYRTADNQFRLFAVVP